jgi:prophage regulatory protein
MKLLRVEELSEMCGVSPRTIRGWLASGRLPEPVRIGERCVRWRSDEVEDWMRAGAPSRREWEVIRRQDD